MLQLFDAADELHPIDARLLRDGIMRIGRDQNADWTIVDADRAISRAHCELEATDGRLTLRCQGSNGVFDDRTGQRMPDGEDVPLALPFAFRVGCYRIAASRAPDDEAIGGGSRTLLLPPGANDDVPDDWSDAPATRDADGSLLEAFCQGAGLDASLLSAEEPAEIMRRAGAVYRQMILGVGELMAERDRARERFRMSRTTIGGAGNNPFKFAPTQRLAVDLLLAGPSSFLSGPAALSASFRDLKRHLVSTFAGLQGALRAAVQSFDPEAIDRAVTDKPGLLKGRGTLQMERVAQRHADLRRQLDQREDGSLDRAFVAAYDAAEVSLTRGHR